MLRRTLSTTFVLMAMFAGVMASSPHTALAANPEGIPASATKGTVVDHIDGDKITIRYLGTERELLMSGMDAPEPGECFFEESSDRLAELAPVGADIYLEQSGDDVDGKQRLLRYVWIPREDTRGYLLNTKLVREGYAGFSDDKDNPRYFDNISDAQDEARENDRGLWGECGAVHVDDQDVAESGPRTTAREGNGLSVAEERYIDDVAVISNEMGQSFRRFAELTQQPRFGENDWTIAVSVEFVTWDLQYAEAQELTPPSAFAEMHAVFLSALEKYTLASDAYIFGLDNFDLPSLENGLALLGEGTALIGDANQMLTEIVAARQGD